MGELKSVLYGEPFVTERHRGGVNEVAVSPDSARVASASHDGIVLVRCSRSGRVLHTLKHDSSVTSVDWSPNGELLLTGSIDKTARVWRGSTGKLLHKLNFEEYVWRVRSRPAPGRAALDDSTFAVAMANPIAERKGAVLLVTASGKTQATFDIDGSRAYGLRLSQDGVLLAAGLYDDTVRLFDSATGRF